MTEYRGITYPRFLYPFLNIWKRIMCPLEYHLFDEVIGEHHYLSCDACGLSVYIERIIDEDDN